LRSKNNKFKKTLWKQDGVLAEGANASVVPGALPCDFIRVRMKLVGLPAPSHLAQRDVAKTISLRQKITAGSWHQANSAKAPGAEQNAVGTFAWSAADLEGSRTVHRQQEHCT
jgi:hypothetical protein